MLLTKPVGKVEARHECRGRVRWPIQEAGRRRRQPPRHERHGGRAGRLRDDPLGQAWELRQGGQGARSL